jgi:hypothetical protein
VSIPGGTAAVTGGFGAVGAWVVFFELAQEDTRLAPLITAMIKDLFIIAVNYLPNIILWQVGWWLIRINERFQG